MAQSLSELIQESRLMVVEVDKGRGLLRVKNAADACSDLSCSKQVLVVTEVEARADLGILNPGDIVKVEPATGPAQKIVVVRRAWEEIASPEI